MINKKRQKATRGMNLEQKLEYIKLEKVKAVKRIEKMRKKWENDEIGALIVF